MGGAAREGGADNSFFRTSRGNAIVYRTASSACELRSSALVISPLDVSRCLLIPKTCGWERVRSPDNYKKIGPNIRRISTSKKITIVTHMFGRANVSAGRWLFDCWIDLFLNESHRYDREELHNLFGLFYFRNVSVLLLFGDASANVIFFSNGDAHPHRVLVCETRISRACICCWKTRVHQSHERGAEDEDAAARAKKSALKRGGKRSSSYSTRRSRGGDDKVGKGRPSAETKKGGSEESLRTSTARPKKSSRVSARWYGDRRARRLMYARLAPITPAFSATLSDVLPVDGAGMLSFAL